MILGGAVMTVGLLVDNVTGIGVANDPLLGYSVSYFIVGLDGMFGKQVCADCGGCK